MKLLRISAWIGGGILVIAILALTGAVIHANLAIRRTETLPAESQAPGQLLSIEGHRWHVAHRGAVNLDPTGAPILLVHGFLVPGHATWLPWAEKLAAQRTLILPDLLGYGHSERVTAAGAYYTLESYSQALESILDALNVPQVDVVGHSYGGVIAARFALDHPARVRHLVLMSAPFYYLKPSSSENIVHLPFGIGRAMTWHMLGAGPVSFVSQYCSYHKPCGWERHVHVRGTTDALRAAMRTHRDTANAAEMLQQITAIETPTLVVWGANDPFFPVDQGQRLAETLGAEIAVIPNAGHMPYHQQPDKVAENILRFLQGG